MSLRFMAEVLGVPTDAVRLPDGDYLKLVHRRTAPGVAHAYGARSPQHAYAIRIPRVPHRRRIGWLRNLAEFRSAGGQADPPDRHDPASPSRRRSRPALRDSEARCAPLWTTRRRMFVKDLDGRFTMLKSA